MVSYPTNFSLKALRVCCNKYSSVPNITITMIENRIVIALGKMLARTTRIIIRPTEMITLPIK